MYMCNKFGVDSSSRFSFRVRTDRQTDAIERLTHAGGYAGVSNDKMVPPLHHLLITSPLWVRSIVISVFVCLYVCSSVRSHISTITQLNFTRFSVHVIHGRNSVPL